MNSKHFLNRKLKLSQRAGKVLKDLRQQSGHSITEFASIIGIDELEVERWECGFGGYHNTSVRSIFKALDSSVDLLPLNLLINEVQFEIQQLNQQNLDLSRNSCVKTFGSVYHFPDIA